jgi:hypothetical protein
VPKDSPIKSVADLKGRKLALNKGSNVHYLLVRLLEKAGVKYTDVELVFLPPAEGRRAFEKGAVDAWVIWEPYRAAAELTLGARTLADGSDLVSNHEFFFTTKTFGEAHPQVIEIVLGAARDVYAEAAMDISGTAKTFSAAPGFPEPAMQVALSRRTFGILPMTNSVIANSRRSPTPSRNSGSSQQRSMSRMPCVSRASDTRGRGAARHRRRLRINPVTRKVAEFRFGSLADIASRLSDVRFTPDSRHQ